MKSNYNKILSPFTFPVSGINITNRIVLAPMTTFSGNDDGTTTDAEVAYYRERNQSAGLLITACAYVIKHGKGFHGQIGADSDELIPSLKRIADALKANGNKAVLQLYHGGRMSPPEELVDGQSLSASAVAAVREGAQVPREMTATEIEETIVAFGEATRRAIEAGFDGVEIHGANTYLLQQFFSPHSNRRTDKWGGDLMKRMTFPLAVVDAVIESAALSSNPFLVGYRLSPEELENPGITMEDTLHLVEALSLKQLDYLHISVMDFWAGSMRDKNDTAPRAQLIATKVGHSLPVIGVGSLHTPEEVERVLTGNIPLVAMARELLMEPHWLTKVKNNAVDQIRTELDVNTQDLLKIPTPLWSALISRTGWLPVKNNQH
ncbi:2,4-dienoyl-CoA reductase [Myroides marinus]|uniref:2,4-dienoyl-CoA reductase n=1 Tax=Myroides marinus TaxID=703342 RepID=A0A1H6UFE3_9FLAO|nr:NADH-dependent flavin oxidoreductase [Myroides marinus]SEI89394.1 2,4-dienoyl-CoA reductase [Myroides marinus]